jgi:DNA-binding transcriptional MerR regulator
MLAAAHPRAKSPEAFRTISEVSDDLDVPQHVLRFWESRFAQVRPVKRAGGRRYYRPEDVDLLRGIRALLYSDGYTIKGVQKILRDRGVRHVAEIGRGEAEIERPAAHELDVEVDIDVAQTDADNVVDLPAVEPTHARAAIALVERAHSEPEIEDYALEPLAEEPAIEEPVAEEVAHQPEVETEAVSAPVEAVEDVAPEPVAEVAAEAVAAVEEPAMSSEKRARLETLLAELLDLKAQLNAAKRQV